MYGTLLKRITDNSQPNFNDFNSVVEAFLCDLVELESGFENETWNNTTYYNPGRAVTYNSQVYRAIIDNQNKQPDLNSNIWEISDKIFTNAIVYQEFDVSNPGDLNNQVGTNLMIGYSQQLNNFDYNNLRMSNPVKKWVIDYLIFIRYLDTKILGNNKRNVNLASNTIRDYLTQNEGNNCQYEIILDTTRKYVLQLQLSQLNSETGVVFEELNSSNYYTSVLNFSLIFNQV